MTLALAWSSASPRDIVLERVQTRRCDHTRLTHPAAESLAPPAHRLDRARVTGHHRPHRSTEALADADRDRVALDDQLGGGDAQRYGGVEQPRSVAVNAESKVVRGARRTTDPRRVDGRAASAVVGVLDGEQRGHRLMDIRIANRRDDRFGIRDAVDAVERAELYARDNRRSTDLIGDQVCLRVGDDLITRPGLRRDARQVAHGAARDEHGGVLAEQPCHLILETSHRRILAPHVVTNLGARHRRSHSRIGNGQRVTPEIDEVKRRHCRPAGSRVHAARFQA